MAKTYDPTALGMLCEALGVERPNEVTRVVVDIRAGHDPMLYVERIGDATKIVAALCEPGIDLQFQAPAREPSAAEVSTGNPALRNLGRRTDGPVLHGNVTGNIAWGNGNVTQRS